MIEDRDYMRGPSYGSPLSVTVVLLIINVVVFVGMTAVTAWAPNFPLNDYFALSLYGVEQWRLWQFITFQFMHAGVLHLLFNCWALYLFGREIERMFGKQRYLIFYLFCGAFGGLVQILGALLWPSHLGGAVVGASAGVYGLVAAFATILPEEPLTLLLFFVLPFNLRAKYLLWISAALAIYGIVFPYDMMANAAHLGGMMAGVFWVRLGWHNDYVQLPWEGLGAKLGRLNPFRSRGPKRELVSTAAGQKRRQSAFSVEPLPEKPPKDFISQDVDPILEKISAHGIQSLTEKERKILEAARKKMSGC